MSNGSEVGAVIGAAIGFAVAGPAGAKAGCVIGTPLFARSKDCRRRKRPDRPRAQTAVPNHDATERKLGSTHS